MQDENTVEQKHHLIEHLDELKEVTADCISKSRQTVQLYTHNLDPRILNHPNISALLTKFIQQSSKVRIEMLIADEANLRGVDHLLINLTQRFTTYSKIKVIPKEYLDNRYAFYLFDGRTMLYRNNAERYETELLTLPNAKLNQMRKLFKEIWQQASPASRFRSLNI
ncbi:MAG: hypothetical protein OEY19_12805 [Gammaproteobacteria bacterium]|nr:hypothetical protein [Gammaproteobacteria bacterium]